MKLILGFFLATFLLPFCLAGQKAATLTLSEVTSLTEYLYVLEDTSGNLAIDDLVRKKNCFTVFTKEIKSKPDQWLRITVQNPDNVAHNAKVSIAFVDYISSYVISAKDTTFQVTGDLLPVHQRNLPVGQMCLIDLYIPARQMTECYLHLKSTTDISNQFRQFSLRSVQLYPETFYQARFQTSRIYQSLFFGAILMMLLYNIFIFSTTRSLSYLTYVLFLLSLIVFLASNNGYLVELIFFSSPRTDLHIRLLSAPFTVIAFLIFSMHYLESVKHTPVLHRAILFQVAAIVILIFAMVSGVWRTGRLLTVVFSVTSFVFILFVAFRVMKKGYTPALYFIIANVLLVSGVICFAMERFEVVSHNPFTQYSVQIAVVFQSVFFSIGLADRIKLVQTEIAQVQLEKERLETLREMERKNLTEEKNKALEASNRELDAFIYKTAHDIRGPVARLMGLSNVGLIEIKDPKSVSYLTLLKNNSYYLNYLLNRLSTAYEIRNRIVNKTLLDVERLVKEDILKELSFNEEYAGSSFSIQIESQLKVNTDPVLLRFILINLIENAIKFCNKDTNDSHNIYISVIVLHNNLVINVNESGLGIREDEKPYLFEMFSKAAGKYKSPGLGLYMSRISTEKLGGTIVLKNSGKPTVFEVVIPLVS